ncbi:helix-turn-helix domain-containing protein [Streptomyces sp. NPDC020800]|uniref:helix-turn-helix domain-containing protein n=1 Tax=Streptomyces sp. NPDC020800 TaxID=3365092 RepID=UPI0037A0F148
MATCRWRLEVILDKNQDRGEMTSKDPALERRRVRLALRTYRNDAHISQPEVAERLSWSPSKVIRIEGGSVGVSVTDLRALLDLYGVTDETIRRDLERATRESRRPPWWAPFREVVDPQFATYLGLESAAHELSAYDPTLVPGLLQTEGYTRALLADGKRPAARTDAIVRLRAERQRRLLEEAAEPRLRFLVDEAALRRWVGGADTMREQLERLTSVARLPHVELSVVPFTLGAHPVLRKGSIALTFRDGDDVLFVEGPSGALTTRDDQDAVDEYLARFEESRSSAVSGDEAIGFIDEVLAQYPS